MLHDMLEVGRRRREGRRKPGPAAGHIVEGRAVSLREAAEMAGVSAQMLCMRMKQKGWTLEEALRYYRDKRAWQEERREKEARAVEEIVDIILNP